MTDDFTPFRVLSFDCYGTLIDWDTGITEALRPWIERHGLTVPHDELLAAFAAHENAVEREQPTARYPELLGEVLRRVGEQLNAEVTASDAATFGDSVGDWPAFDDSADALARLHARFSLIILSNVDRASFARSNRRLGVDFDRIITAEDVGSYKPNPRNFEVLLDEVAEMGHTRGDLLHVAQSLYHDHVPAKAFALRSAWIDRRHIGGSGATPTATGDVTPDWRFESMAAFADAAGV